MKKSLKRAIACLLAVLMVAFSMPFSAFAAASDNLTPDIRLQFYPLHLDGEDYFNYEGDEGSGPLVTPLYDVPLDYNLSTGKLTLTVAKSTAFGNAVDADYQYGAGDYFLMTVILKDVPSIKAFGAQLKVPAGIQPVAIYGDLTDATFDADVAEEQEFDPYAAAGEAIEAGSADTFYELEAASTSVIEDGVMTLEATSAEDYAEITDIKATKKKKYTNPNTGAVVANGQVAYAAGETAIIATFAFQITSDNYGAWSINNPSGDGTYFCADTEDTDETLIYSYGTYTNACTRNNKMTFFGTNVNTAPAEHTHTLTHVAAVAATCAAAGNIEYWVCDQGADACGKYFSDANGTTEITQAETVVAIDPTAHNYGDWAVTTAAVTATCTTAGATAVETRVCANDATHTETRGGETVAALGHNYESVVTAPTCTEQGYTTYTCSRCGDSYVANYVDALGHTAAAAVQENVVAATCTAAGSYDEVVYCSVCGAEISREAKTIAALGHDFSVFVETVAPTCTEGGYTTYKCSRCDATENRDATDATGHTAAAAVQENVVAATCTADGSYDEVVYCSVCGAELSREAKTITALGHDMGEWQDAGGYVAPTCTEDGTNGGQIRYCSRCDYFETQGGETIPALGHVEGDPVTENNVDPSCTEAGSYDTVVYCTRCGAELSRETTTVDALGHDLGDWTEYEEAVEATCTEAGKTAVERQYCSRCDFYNERGGEVIDALDHNYEAVVTDPTCTEDGYTTYTCSRCGDSYVANYVDALGHDFVLKEHQDATEDEDGYDYYECSRCDETKTDVIPALEHVHVAGEAVEENVVPATCTEAGSKEIVVYCTKGDGYEFSRETVEIPALNHAWGEWTVTTAAVPATCEEDGTTAIETRVCANDASHTETRGGDTVAALGHDWGEWTVTTAAVPATCEEDGVTAVETRVCANDASHTETRGGETVVALGHAWGEWTVTTAAVAPTRTTAGSTAVETRVCANDASHTETRGGEVIPALEGIYISIGEYDTNLGTATFTKTGKTAYENGYLYEEDAKYAVKATASDNGVFVGWAIDSRIVSEKATYSNTAYTDLVLTPVFIEKAEQETQTVVFLSKYGDILSTQPVPVETVPSAATVALNGYTFLGWKINNEGDFVDEAAIKALTESAKIYAVYEKDAASTGYTVTIDGEGTIKDKDGNVIDGTGLTFDTKVTVSAEGATAWKVGDEIVSYESDYTFYVGGNITLTPVFDEVEEEAKVYITGATAVANTDTKWNIFATRTTPEGSTAIDRGFVYGSDATVPATVAEIDLDNPSGYKVTHGTPTASEQFSLTIGIKKTSTAAFYAYVTYVDASGTHNTVFSQRFVKSGADSRE